MDPRNKIMNNQQVSGSDYPVELIEAMDFDQLIVDAVFHSDQTISAEEFNKVATEADLFDFGSGNILNPLSAEGMREEDYEDEDEDNESTENESSVTATTPRGRSKKRKVDRTRTLVSERKRRGRMKEKLFALRALVPNITKMDKASIVGDAVLYVQQLQMQAKELKAEIVDLESSLKDPTPHRNVVHNNNNKNSIARIVAPAPKMITQMEAFQVEEREFYVRIQSNKGEGVAVSLYKALESFSRFVVRTSNLTTVRDTFIVTFTIGDCEEDFDVPNVKMWIARALVSQGFELRTAV